MTPNDRGTIRRTPTGDVAIRFEYFWFVVGETEPTGVKNDAEVADWPVIFHPGGFFGVDDKLRRIRWLAESWFENYDRTPANDPRDTSEAQQAYDDAGFQLLHVLNDDIHDAWGRVMYGPRETTLPSEEKP